MADSLSFGGALPVAAIAACCESFQLSLLAMTFPLASRNESVGFASGVVTPQSDRPEEQERQRMPVTSHIASTNQTGLFWSISASVDAERNR